MLKFGGWRLLRLENMCVTGAGYSHLESLGSQATELDIYEQPIEGLIRSESPLYVPGMEGIMPRDVRNHRLTFSPSDSVYQESLHK